MKYIRVYENGSKRYLRNVGNHAPERCRHNPEETNYLNTEQGGNLESHPI
jgi:hypothetical protein